jgi:hypothetical protein
MTNRQRTARNLLGMTAPVALLTLLGLITAAAHLQLATFALGAWTFPLAVAAPAVIAGRMLMANHSVQRASLMCTSAIALNLAIEALGTTAQLAILG